MKRIPAILATLALVALIILAWHPKPHQAAKPAASAVKAVVVAKPAPVSPPSTPPPTPVPVPKTEEELVIEAVNTIRVQHGLVALTESAKLDQVATSKLADMCQYKYWAHDNPNGTSWVSFFAGYNYAVIGENLAAGYNGDVPSIVRAWVDSPEHYANIVNPVYRETGMAYVHCANYLGRLSTPIVANEFGVQK